MIGTHVREMYTEENKSNHHRITKDHHSSCHLSEYTPQKFPCRLLMWPHKNNLDCCLHCSEQQGDNGVPPPACQQRTVLQLLLHNRTRLPLLHRLSTSKTSRRSTLQPCYGSLHKNISITWPCLSPSRWSSPQC